MVIENEPKREKRVVYLASANRDGNTFLKRPMGAQNNSNEITLRISNKIHPRSTGPRR